MELCSVYTIKELKYCKFTALNLHFIMVPTTVLISHLPFTRVKIFNDARLRSIPFVMSCVTQKLGFPLYPFILLFFIYSYSLLKYKKSQVQY